MKGCMTLFFITEPLPAVSRHHESTGAYSTVLLAMFSVTLSIDKDVYVRIAIKQALGPKS